MSSGRSRSRRWVVPSIATLALGAGMIVLIATRNADPPSGRDVGPPRRTESGNEMIAEALVTEGSPDGDFPRSRQNEPSVAFDPSAPNVVAAGANDLIDVAPCAPPAGPQCRRSPGVGVSGVYLSFDSGRTWRQPTYEGWSARDGKPGRGPIGTLPRYYEQDLMSYGDPSVAFGPRPGADGSFSWETGSRLYYANLAFPFPHTDPSFQGRSAIAISHADDLASAARGHERAWSTPVIASSRLGRDAMNDKEAIWADRSSSSPHFGNVYVCWTVFGGRSPLQASIVISRSTDGGRTWSRPTHLTSDRNTAHEGGRQACAVRTDSKGGVYVVWWDTPRDVDESIQVLARSADGGRTFSDPRTIARVHDVGRRDPLSNDRTFDGVGGSRTNSFPSVSIADGAPEGEGATDRITVAWADAREGFGDEQAVLTWSADAGRTWSQPWAISTPGDRVAMPAVAIAPRGATIHVVYDAFLREWRQRAGAPRPVRGVVISAALDQPLRDLDWTTVFASSVGDARASTTSTFEAGGLYDYNAIAATDDWALGLWNDVRRGAVCPAADRYRQRRLEGDHHASIGSCPARFGNTDVFGALIDGP